MRRFVHPFLVLLSLAGAAGAQGKKADPPAPPAPTPGPSITVPAEVRIDEPGFIVIKASAVDADAVRWYPLSKPALKPVPDYMPQPPLGTFAAFTFTGGTYKIGVICAKVVGGKAVISEPQVIVVTVGTPAPQPPIPPGPTPGPAPVPDVGLHVLVVYDKAKETTLPQGQQDVLFGAQTRAYLTAKCAKVAGKADWGIWPDGGDASAYPSAPLKAMYARPRASVPWVVISKDGAAGFEGPLPADVPAALALFSKYGG